RSVPLARFTLPWRGRVGERSEPGWGELCFPKCKLTPPRLPSLRSAVDPPPPGEGEASALLLRAMDSARGSRVRGNERSCFRTKQLCCWNLLPAARGCGYRGAARGLLDRAG